MFIMNNNLLLLLLLFAPSSSTMLLFNMYVIIVLYFILFLFMLKCNKKYIKQIVNNCKKSWGNNKSYFLCGIEKKSLEVWFNVTMLQGAIGVEKKDKYYSFVFVFVFVFVCWRGWMNYYYYDNFYSFFLYCTTLMHNDKIFQVSIPTPYYNDSSNEFNVKSSDFYCCRKQLITNI